MSEAILHRLRRLTADPRVETILTITKRTNATAAALFLTAGDIRPDVVKLLLLSIVVTGILLFAAPYYYPG